MAVALNFTLKPSSNVLIDCIDFKEFDKDRASRNLEDSCIARDL